MVQNQHEFYPSGWVSLNRRTRVSLNRRAWVSLNRPRWVSLTDVCSPLKICDYLSVIAVSMLYSVFVSISVYFILLGGVLLAGLGVSLFVAFAINTIMNNLITNLQNQGQC